MEISLKERKVFSEVDAFLDALGPAYINKIPEDIRKLFKEEKDKAYKKEIDLDLSIEGQGFMKESIDTILWLNLEYWCTNEDEKDVLEKMYDNNQKISEELKREKYNPDNIFNSPSKKSEALVVSNEKRNIFVKIVEKIKQFFNKKDIQDEM